MKFAQKTRAVRVAAVLFFFASLAVIQQSPGAPARRVELRVIVVGPGAVRSQTRSCKRRCTWRVPAGALLRLRAVPGRTGRFERWSTRCGGHQTCSFRAWRKTTIRARFAATVTPLLANPHVSCVATRTTIPAILGKLESPAGGATEAGGWFQPHLAGDGERHLLDPPCFIRGEPTFVELDGVYVEKFSPSSDGDWTGNLVALNRADIGNPQMKTIHAEIDYTWIAAGVAPMPAPTSGMTVDVQGFVYWDPGHLDAPWHSHSGWELHPVSAWRLSR